METKTKECRGCHIEKPLSDFGQMIRNKDGKKAKCRKCESARTLKWKEKRKKENKWDEAFIF